MKIQAQRTVAGFCKIKCLRCTLHFPAGRGQGAGVPRPVLREPQERGSHVLRAGPDPRIRTGDPGDSEPLGSPVAGPCHVPATTSHAGATECKHSDPGPGIDQAVT